jgi:hypothetical protein
MGKKTKTETATPIEAELVLDNSDVPEFEIVRTVKTGRPLFLTSKRFVRICKLIEQGESASEACRQQLVTYARFRFHVQRNEKYQRRLKQAEQVREQFLYEFHMANVKKHAPRNVISSLWWLERRYPERFALRTVVRNEGGTGEKAGYTMLSREQLLAILEAERVVEAERPRTPELADVTPVDNADSGAA